MHQLDLFAATAYERPIPEKLPLPDPDPEKAATAAAGRQRGLSVGLGKLHTSPANRAKLRPADSEDLLLAEQALNVPIAGGAWLRLSALEAFVLDRVQYLAPKSGRSHKGHRWVFWSHGRWATEAASQLEREITPRQVRTTIETLRGLGLVGVAVARGFEARGSTTGLRPLLTLPVKGFHANHLFVVIAPATAAGEGLFPAPAGKVLRPIPAPIGVPIPAVAPPIPAPIRPIPAALDEQEEQDMNWKPFFMSSRKKSAVCERKENLESEKVFLPQKETEIFSSAHVCTPKQEETVKAKDVLTEMNTKHQTFLAGAGESSDLKISPHSFCLAWTKLLNHTFSCSYAPGWSFGEKGAVKALLNDCRLAGVPPVAFIDRLFRDWDSTLKALHASDGLYPLPSRPNVVYVAKHAKVFLDYHCKAKAGVKAAVESNNEFSGLLPEDLTKALVEKFAAKKD